jgi:hypothetical protein
MSSTTSLMRTFVACCLMILTAQLNLNAQCSISVSNAQVSVGGPATYANPYSCTTELNPTLVPVAYSGTGCGAITTVQFQRASGLGFIPAVGNATIDGSDVGTTVRVQVTGYDAAGNIVNRTWANLLVEDKMPPVIECPLDVTLYCAEIGTGLFPAYATTGDLGLDGFAPSRFGTAIDGRVQDCTYMGGQGVDQFSKDFNFEAECTKPYASGSSTATTTAVPTAAMIRTRSNNEISLVDATALAGRITAGISSGDIIRVIIRCWTAADHHGNVSPKPCYQLILVRKTSLNNVFGPTDRELNCRFVTGPADYAPSVTGYPVLDIDGNPATTNDQIELIPGSGSCKIDATYADQRVELCPGSYKIVRIWTVLDWCAIDNPETPRDERIKYFTQLIKVLDQTEPVATYEFTSNTRNATNVCYIDLWGNRQNYTVYQQLSQSTVAGTFSGYNRGSSSVNPTGVALTALSNQVDCGATVSIKFTVSDPYCTGTNVTLSSSDSRFSQRVLNRRVVDGVSECDILATASYIEPGVYNVTFTAADECGYAIATERFTITVTDNKTPDAICKSLTDATLTNDGTVRVHFSSFDNGSRDNCGVKKIFARRMDGQRCDLTSTSATNPCGRLVSDNNCFKDYVEFGCCDAGETLQVILGVIDINDNYSECMARIVITDKINPTCIAPRARELSCTEAVAALNNLAQFGTPTAWDNCPGVQVRETSVAPVAANILDNCKVGSYTRRWEVRDCKGLNPVTCSQTISFTKLSDFTVDFPDDISVKCFSAIPAAASLQTQLEDPASWTKNWDGAVLNQGCGVLQISVEDYKVEAVPDACRKIFRRVTVLDWCKYNRNNDLVDLDANCFGDPVPGDQHGYGIASKSNVTLGANGTSGARSTNDATWQILNPWRTSGETTQDRRFRDADGIQFGPSNGPNNVPHPFAFSDGIMCFDQIIKVVDTDAPTATVTDTVVCDYAADCEAAYRYQLVANDGCGGRPAVLANGVTPINYSWSIRGITDPTFVRTSSNASGLINLSLPYGEYNVTWTATDLCMKVGGPWTFKVTTKDCKAPSFFRSSLDAVAALMPTGTPGSGMIEIWATEFSTVSIEDNCATQAFMLSKLSITRASATVSGSPLNALTLTCADLAASPVAAKLWTNDGNGNSVWIPVSIIVTDPNRACSGATVATIAGTVGTSNNRAVANVDVTVSGTGANTSVATANTGQFSINTLTRGANYQVRSAKPNASADATDGGVTARDLAIMSRHIGNTEPLTSPYALLAGDVNNDNAINAADLLLVRRVILTLAPGFTAGNWRFIDKAYTFRNPTSPFNEDISEVVNLNQVAPSAQANFVAIRRGDVNGTYNGLTMRTDKSLTLSTDDIALVAGNEYTVTFAANNAASDFQFTLSFANGAAQLKSVKGGEFMNDANFGLFDRNITTVWAGNEKIAGKQLFNVTFVANKSGMLSDVLSLGSERTQAVATAEGQNVNVNLSFNNGKVSGGEFALYQNQPNPVANSTEIGFNLPTDGSAKLTIFNVEGKVLMVKNGTYKAGYNKVEITKSELNANGVLYYRLDTPEHSASRKMIILE